MKLRYSPTSPFARKVMVVAHEHGLAERIELMPAMTSPVEPNADVARDNPLAKIPSLTLDDGSTLYDSRVIAEYLDQLAGAKLFPPPGPYRWAALRQQALADGLLEAAVLIRYERVLRPAQITMAGLDRRPVRQGRSSAQCVRKRSGGLGKDYHDRGNRRGLRARLSRFPLHDFNWRQSRTRLTSFYDKFSERPSMVATRPPSS